MKHKKVENAVWCKVKVQKCILEFNGAKLVPKSGSIVRQTNLRGIAEGTFIFTRYDETPLFIFEFQNPFIIIKLIVCWNGTRSCLRETYYHTTAFYRCFWVFIQYSSFTWIFKHCSSQGRRFLLFHFNSVVDACTPIRRVWFLISNIVS